MGTVTATSSNYIIYPTNSTLDGVPYNGWITKWWVWNLGIPNSTHPLWNPTEPDVERCSSMQKGPVWFLPNALSGEGIFNHQCNVPFGKVIMIPVSLTECDHGTEGVKPDDDLKVCAFNIYKSVSNIKIDGVPVNTGNLGTPIRTDFFNVTYPHNPISKFGYVEPGSYRAIASGYLLFLHNLPVGIHNLHMKVVDFLSGKDFLKGVGETSEANYTISVR